MSHRLGIAARSTCYSILMNKEHMIIFLDACGAIAWRVLM